MVNSTGLHNRSWLNGHGQLDEADLDGPLAEEDEPPTHGASPITRPGRSALEAAS